MVVVGRSPHIKTGLQAHHIAVEPGLRIALPVNLAALPDQPAPGGAQRALVVQQALLALPFVERAEAGQRRLAQQGRHHRVGGGLHAAGCHRPPAPRALPDRSAAAPAVAPAAVAVGRSHRRSGPDRWRLRAAGVAPARSAAAGPPAVLAVAA
ncbi:hypothetical protein G6F23_014548 [Rhizopus arrhizus]|nr:hypothetical protein G6F23_014548 [Rhizopus arrhizus]